MKKTKNLTSRREFISLAGIAAAGVALGASGITSRSSLAGKRIGLIGLDSSHCVNFTKAFNDPSAPTDYNGYKVTAAYPKGSLDIESSVIRIPGYTEDVKKMGVEITNSIEELLEKTDVIYMITNDGRRHLEQSLIVFRAGKRMFIDKPMAASLKDAIDIFSAAEHYNVPVWSGSALRFRTLYQEIANGSIGKVYGADIYGPSPVEKTHPTLFWYGIHSVESLCTIMGTGCESVSRVYNEKTDISVGIWPDNRLGTVRAMRTGSWLHGGNAYGEKGIVSLTSTQYTPELIDPAYKKLVGFFDTGIVPVTKEQTLEILAFMEAADESMKKEGKAVRLDAMMIRAANSSGRLKL